MKTNEEPWCLWTYHHAYVHMYMWIYVCRYICICIYSHICIYIYIYICMYIYIYICKHAYMHTHIHTYMQVYLLMHTYILSRKPFMINEYMYLCVCQEAFLLHENTYAWMPPPVYACKSSHSVSKKRPCTTCVQKKPSCMTEWTCICMLSVYLTAKYARYLSVWLYTSCSPT
jgi:hypothetical protein